MTSEPLWEVQWHPASGGQVRRLVLTRRGLRRLLVGLAAGVVLILAILGVLPLGLRGLFARFTVEAAKSENVALHAEEESLRDRAFAIATGLHGVLERARRLAWAVRLPSSAWQPSTPAPPGQAATDDQLTAWLLARLGRLDTLGDALAVSPDGAPCPLPALPAAAPLELAHAVAVERFGWRVSPFTGKQEAHHGITLAAPRGEVVVAPGDARVVFAGAPHERRANEWTRFGTIVVLDHGGGVLTVLGHLDAASVRRGQLLKRGQRVGAVGQTGWTRVPALYFEVRWPVGGRSVPIDPGLVCLGLPVDDLDARLADPEGGLPGDFAPLERLAGR